MTDALGDTAPREPLPTGPRRFLTPRLIVAANVALAGLLTALSLAGPVGVTDPSAYVGTVPLVASILPSNLSCFARFSQNQRLRSLTRLRKPLGIRAGVWFFVHSAASVWEHFDLSVPLGPRFARTGILIGLVATLVFVLMLATSTFRAQRARPELEAAAPAGVVRRPALAGPRAGDGRAGAAGRRPLRRDHGLRRLRVPRPAGARQGRGADPPGLRRRGDLWCRS